MSTYSTLSERIHAMRRKRNITQEELSLRLGVTRQALSAIEKGGSPSLDLFTKLAKEFDVSYNELLHGENSGEKKPGDPIIVVDSNNSPAIKLIPIHAQAGYVEERNAPSYWEEMPTIALPDEKYKRRHYVGFQVSGDSMEPTFFNGDWVICSQVDRHNRISPNQAYVVVTQYNLLLKRVKNNVDEGTITLLSDNTFYEPQTLRNDEIREIWLADTIIRFFIPSPPNPQRELR